MLPAAKRVTALHELAGGKVAVDLDGEEWRVLPVAAVARAGLGVGAVVDRNSARELGRALRRDRALGVAACALRHRDMAREELAARLDRAGIVRLARTEALEALERTGLVDDGRFALDRAASLAGRGYGDAAVRADLERRGVSADVVRGALAALEPEHLRAQALVARRGPGKATARRLAGRGFGDDAVEAALGAAVADGEVSE